MAKYVKRMNRCLVCSIRPSAIILGTLELCSRCCLARMECIEPGYRIELAVVEEGYDFPDEDSDRDLGGANGTR